MEDTNMTSASGTRDERRKFQLSPLVLGLGFGILGAVLWSLYSPGATAAVTVNGESISVQDLRLEAERLHGEQVLEGLIIGVLLNDAKAKRGFSVTDEEIEEAMKTYASKVETTGETLEEMLARNGVTKDELAESLRDELEQEKLVADRLSATDLEINAYIGAHPELLEEGVKLDDEDLRTRVRELVEAEKVSSEYTKLLEELRAEANVIYGTGYGPSEE